jgi:Raf kinase inhibitor-like YbhB/YbcL family protein
MHNAGSREEFMTKIIAILTIFCIVMSTCIASSEEGAGKKMEITSPEFRNNEFLPLDVGYNFKNVNPELNIANIPAGTKSMVLIVDDPDAPRATWVHWVMYDMPVVEKIGRGDSFGKQGVNDYKTKNYGGPCPPSGTHRYFFKLYALDKMLDLKDGLDKKSVEKAMEGHIIEEAEIVGLYKK